jgi:hypothetical protein
MVTNEGLSLIPMKRQTLQPNGQPAADQYLGLIDTFWFYPRRP